MEKGRGEEKRNLTDFPYIVEPKPGAKTYLGTTVTSLTGRWTESEKDDPRACRPTHW